MEFNLGNRLAQIVADLVYANGGCGPFGGERPIVNGNILTLHSQAGRENYKFNNDGTVSLIATKQQVLEYADELGISYNLALQDFEHYKNMDILDLVEGRTDLSWFMYLEEGRDKVVQFLEMLFDN